MESSLNNSNAETKKSLNEKNETTGERAEFIKNSNIEITSSELIDDLHVETNERNELASLSVHSATVPYLAYNEDEQRRRSKSCAQQQSQSLSSRNSESREGSMFRSMTSLSGDEDPWKASSIGIKCISYKPVGYMLLSRRILDLYATDGSHKIEIFYSYSKKFRNKIKIPSIGSSMRNCSFCDTITLDFDPDSTMFDLVMEVQIITQGATIDRKLKVRQDESGQLSLIRERRKRKSTTPTLSRVSGLVEQVSNSEESSNSSGSDDDNTVVFSSYDLKVHNSSSPQLNAIQPAYAYSSSSMCGSSYFVDDETNTLPINSCDSYSTGLITSKLTFFI
jgi:hypothetical protein